MSISLHFKCAKKACCGSLYQAPLCGHPCQYTSDDVHFVVDFPKLQSKKNDSCNLYPRANGNERTN